MRRILSSVVIVLIAAAGVFYFTRTKSGDAISVVEEQLAFLKAGDASAAYALTTSGFQKKTSLEAFEEYVDANPALNNNTSYSFSSTEIDSTGAILKGDFVAVDGTVQSIEYDIVREEGAWKIYRMNVGE